LKQARPGLRAVETLLAEFDRELGAKWAPGAITVTTSHVTLRRVSEGEDFQISVDIHDRAVYVFKGAPGRDEDRFSWTTKVGLWGRSIRSIESFINEGDLATLEKQRISAGLRRSVDPYNAVSVAKFLHLNQLVIKAFLTEGDLE